MVATTLLESWDHLPHFVRAIILGNLIQAGFVTVVRLIVGRFQHLQPLVDRIGPRALRTRGAKGAGLGVAIAWFVLSWYVGHAAMKWRGDVVGWLNR